MGGDARPLRSRVGVSRGDRRVIEAVDGVGVHHRLEVVQRVPEPVQEVRVCASKDRERVSRGKCSSKTEEGGGKASAPETARDSGGRQKRAHR